MKKVLSMLFVGLILTGLLAGCASDGGQSGIPTETQAETETVEETEATKAIEQFDPVEPIAIENHTLIEDYDLTGDGVADSLWIECVEPWEDLDWGDYGYHWEFLINGEPAMIIRTDWPVCPETELYQVGGGRNYLAICQRLDTNDDSDDFGLYQYSGGELIKVCDFYCSNLDMAHIFHYGAEVVSVAGDRILLRCWNQFNATAYLHWEMEFLYENGSWMPNGNVYPVVYEEYMEDKSDGMTANQPLTVYTGIDCGEIAYTVDKGGVLFLDRLCIEEGLVYFHVTNEAGQEGWLKDPEEVYMNLDGEELFGWFEEAMFAG